MNIRVVVFLFMLLSHLSIEAQEFEKMRFNGFVTEFGNENTVQYGAIRNQQTGEVALTDLDGEFSISGTVGDTLKFRCMGYKATTWVIPGIWTTMEDTIKLNVNSNIYALEEVEVIRYYSYAHFKQAFKDLRIEKTEAELAKENAISWNFKEAIAQGVSDAKFGHGTFGLTMSPGGKDKISQKRETIERLEGIYDASSRFRNFTSKENIKQLTGYNGTCLDSFMVYLNTDYKLVHTMPEYDLLATIVKASDNFEFIKGDAVWFERLVD